MKLDRFVVKTTRLPVEVGEALDGLAERRQLTASALLRALVDAALSEAQGAAPRGPVESAVLAEIEGLGYRSSPGRVATALELARRLDKDPTSGAQNAGQIRLLLEDLERAVSTTAVVDSVVMARMLRVLRLAGFTVVAADGRPFTLADDFEPERFAGVLT